MARGRVDEAEIILADIEGLDVNDPFIITQSKDIQWAVQYEKDHAVRWRDLLRGRTGDQAGTHTIRRVLLGMGTQAMQQLCQLSHCLVQVIILTELVAGINVTSYYLPTVLIESVGLTNNLARLLAACNSVSYLLFSPLWRLLGQGPVWTAAISHNLMVILLQNTVEWREFKPLLIWVLYFAAIETYDLAERSQFVFMLGLLMSGLRLQEWEKMMQIIKGVLWVENIFNCSEELIRDEVMHVVKHHPIEAVLAQMPPALPDHYS